MKLVSIEPIRLKRVPAGPINSVDPDSAMWPELDVATIELRVNDGFAEDVFGAYEVELKTRLVMTDASEPLPSLEQRALRQLASQLRAVADALEAGPAANV